MKRPAFAEMAAPFRLHEPTSEPRRPVPAKMFPASSLPLRVLKLEPSRAPIMARFLATKSFYGSAWTRLAEDTVFTEAPAHVTNSVVLPDRGPLEAESLEVFSFPAGPGEGLCEVAFKRLMADGYRVSTETPLEVGGDFEVTICPEASTDGLAYGTGPSFPAALAAALTELESWTAERPEREVRHVP